MKTNGKANISANQDWFKMGNRRQAFQKPSMGNMMKLPDDPDASVPRFVQLQMLCWAQLTFLNRIALLLNRTELVSGQKRERFSFEDRRSPTCLALVTQGSLSPFSNKFSTSSADLFLEKKRHLDLLLEENEQCWIAWSEKLQTRNTPPTWQKKSSNLYFNLSRGSSNKPKREIVLFF